MKTTQEITNEINELPTETKVTESLVNLIKTLVLSEIFSATIGTNSEFAEKILNINMNWKRGTDEETEFEKWYSEQKYKHQN